MGPYRRAAHKIDPEWRRAFFLHRKAADLRDQLCKLWRALDRIPPSAMGRWSVEQLQAEFLERRAEQFVRTYDPGAWLEIARSERLTRNENSAQRTETLRRRAQAVLRAPQLDLFAHGGRLA